MLCLLSSGFKSAACVQVQEIAFSKIFISTAVLFILPYYLGKKCTDSIYFFFFPLKRQIMFILFLLLSSHPEHLPSAVKICREEDWGPVVFIWYKLFIAPLNLCWVDIVATIVHNVLLFSGSIKDCTNWRFYCCLLWQR